jgi:hypothetical protein
MAAGLGYKDFVTGEVLTAGDVDGYLMQGIWVFANATARDAAVTSPQEGNFAYLKDTNVTTYYTGSTWANLDTTGMTNPMTTTGDTIYSSSGSTPARLGLGTAGQVLTVNSGATAPEWATPAGGGGKVLQVVSAVYSTVTIINSTSMTDTGLTASITPSSATSKILVLANGHFYMDRGTTLIKQIRTQIVRGATTIFDDGTNYSFGIAIIGGTSTDVGGNIRVPFTYLDSPSTTSATTYKIQASTNNASGNMAAQYDGADSSIILMEIGA